MTGRSIKTIAVYCGSNIGQGDVYLRAADALGRHLAKSGIGIVYGGTHKGLMGALADAAIAEGGMVMASSPSGFATRATCTNNCPGTKSCRR